MTVVGFLGSFTHVQEALTTVTAAPDRLTVGAAFLIAAAAVTWQPVWRWIKYFVTTVHECCHATSAYAFGGSVPRIKIRADASGETAWATRGGTIGRVITTMAGYVGVGAVAVGTASLIGTGHVTAVIFLTVAVALMAITSARSLFTVAILAAVVASTVALYRYAPANIQTFAPTTITWILLFGAVRDVHILAHSSEENDATILTRLTGIGRRFWIALFYTATVAAAGYGTWMLATRAI